MFTFLLLITLFTFPDAFSPKQAEPVQCPVDNYPVGVSSLHSVNDLDLTLAIEQFKEAHPNDEQVEASVASLLDLVNKGQFPEVTQETFINPALYAYFVINCALVRTEHPDWSSWEVYLEATWRTLSGVIHTSLDICGLIPAGGEPCDLINGVIYTLEGNPVDAGLSFSATLPIAGWAATGAKWAGIAVLFRGATHHLDVKIVNGIVDFGRPGKLRSILGITNKLKEAHHVIPWAKTNHPLVQKAGKGNFHMNHPFNGMELEKFRFSNPDGVHANHPAYNDKVSKLMNDLWTKLTNRYNGAANVPATVAKDKLVELQQNIVAHIKANPTVKINELTLSGVHVPNVP